MRHSVFTLVWATAALLALPVLADDAPTARTPAPKVGDLFVFASRFWTVDCSRWEVTAVGKDGFNLLQCGTKTAYVDAATGRFIKIIDGDKRLVEFKPLSPTIDFPLQVGKKWDGQYEGYRAYDGASWKSKVSCEAKAFEPVKVAAGEFEAYRIQCADNWESFPFSGESDSTAWYVPQLGMAVKSVNPSQSAFDYELTAYKVQ
jgi:hypothetical protein